MIAMLNAGLTLVPRLFPFALFPPYQKAWTVYITGGVRCNFTDCGCVSNLLWRWPFLCQMSQTWTTYTLFDVVNKFTVFFLRLHVCKGISARFNFLSLLWLSARQ